MNANEINRRFKRNPQTAQVLIAALAQGWRIKETTNGAIAYPPDRMLSGVTVHSTPSDHRAHANFLSRMRKSGFQG